MTLSVKFILVIVLLQLSFSEEYEFGDLLSFRRLGIAYKHYAVYVGNEAIDGKNEGDDIFEMIRDPPGCRFAKLEGKATIEHKDYEKKTPEQIKARIIILSTLETCQKYHLMANNCEQIASYIIYGEWECKQKGTLGAIACAFCAWLEKHNIKCGKLKREVAAGA